MTDSVGLVEGDEHEEKGGIKENQRLWEEGETKGPLG